MVSQLILGVHFFLALALIFVILLQRSEGGALGIGGPNAFTSVRGRANFLSKTTAFLAGFFFLTSVGLTFLARHQTTSGLPFETLPSSKAPASSPSVLPQLPDKKDGTKSGEGALKKPQVPAPSQSGPAAPPIPTTP